MDGVEEGETSQRAASMASTLVPEMSPIKRATAYSSVALIFEVYYCLLKLMIVHHLGEQNRSCVQFQGEKLKV